MNINAYKEILNISSSIWISKGITGIEFKERLLVEKDIDPMVVKEKYNRADITDILTHSVVGFQVELLYHRNHLHGAFVAEIVPAKRVQDYIRGSISQYELVGTENICNLYQSFVQSLIAEGVTLKINQYANSIEGDRNIQRNVDILSQRRLGGANEHSYTQTTTNDSDIS